MTSRKAQTILSQKFDLIRWIGRHRFVLGWQAERHGTRDYLTRAEPHTIWECNGPNSNWRVVPHLRGNWK